MALGIVQLKKILMEQSDRLGEITGENLARTPSKQVTAEIREVIDTFTETVNDFTLNVPELAAALANPFFSQL